MTLTEYVLNFALVGLVVLQMRGRKLTKASLLLPLVITAWVATSFLRSVPTAGNDLVLEVGLGTLGAVLGALAACFTKVRRNADGTGIAKAGIAAGALWVLGIGARIGFSLYVQNGGQSDVARFSVSHGIMDAHAWGVAFVLMAIAEVACRTGLLFLKARNACVTIERGGLRDRFQLAA